MFDAGTLAATLSLSILPFTQQMAAANAQVKGFANQFSSNFQQFNQQMQGLGASQKSLNDGFKDMTRIVNGILIAQAFYKGVQAIQEASSAVLKFSMDMQDAETSFTYFLGTQDRAKAFLETIKDFAAVTPFSTDQAVGLAKQLMNVGFKPENITSVMTVLSDAASASGGTAEQMNRIVLALTQIQAKGRLAGQEIMQLANANIPIYQILQEQLGLTGKQLGNIGKISIPANEAIIGILQGLQKRYQGANQKIAQNMRGMLNTIKDDFLIVGDKVLQGPFGKLNDTVRKVRDEFEKARAITTQSGLGGLFESVFPPVMQTTIRSITGALGNIMGSIQIFLKTIGPEFVKVLSAFAVVAANVLPIVAGLFRGMVLWFQAITQNIPVVKLLVDALAGLLIANFAAKALTLLWSVTRIGVICSAVAEAVRTLVAAIRALTIALVEDPITAVIMVVAASLLYLALSSKTAQEWLDNMMKSLANMAGINLGGILQPENGKSLSDQVAQFNKQLDGMNGDLTKVGANAQAAGKKVKDTFIASFDEVFSIPQNIDQVANGLGNIANINPFKFDDTFTKDKKYNTPTIPGLGNNGGGGIPPAPPGNSGGGPTITPPNVSAVASAVGTINSLLAGLQGELNGAGAAISAWGSLVSQSITAMGITLQGSLATVGQWVATVTDDMAIVAKSIVSSVYGWTVPTISNINTWTINTGAAISQWVSQVGASIGLWVNSTIIGIGNWATATAASFANWYGITLNQLQTWVSDTVGSINTWAAITLTSIGTWVNNTIALLDGWARSTLTSINTWAVNTISIINSWAAANIARINAWSASTLSTINVWSANTIAAIVAWSTSTQSYFEAWFSNVQSNMTLWATGTYDTIKSWVNSTAYAIYQFAYNAGNYIAIMVNSTIQNISNMVNITASDITVWANGVLAGIVSFGNSFSNALSTAMLNGASVIDQFASNAWNTLNAFITGAGQGIAAFANSFMNSLVTAAQNAYAAFAAAAAGMGGKVASAINVSVNWVGNTASSIGGWVSQNKGWLVPVGIGAAAVLGTAAVVASGGALAPALGTLLALETGGIVDKDQLVRIGEGNKREAVIPLENSSYMQPFSKAVANDLLAMLSGSGSNNASSQMPSMYVQYLIADDRGLKELYRRMNVIMLQENQRKGLST